ncbi:MAG: DUF374 domain-containing protein [Planctomycetes bacterium]|nr:DUF374 domain-containing protein [Planctomycetota bacterium]
MLPRAVDLTRTKKSKWTKRALAWLAGALGPWLLRTLGRSWRVRRVGQKYFDVTGPEGQRPVFVMWHQNAPSGSAVHRGEPLVVLASTHRDGEIIARTTRNLGYRTLRGSTSRGGARVLRELLTQADPAWGLVLTPDGPRGPRHSVAPGAIYIAAMSGRPVVATGLAAQRQWKLNSWDRMRFPGHLRAWFAVIPSRSFLTGRCCAMRSRLT